MLVYKPLSEPNLPAADLSITIGIPKRNYKFYLKLAGRFGLIWLLGLPFILNLYWYKSVTDSDPYIVQSLRAKLKSVRLEDSYQVQEMGEVITYLVDNRKDGLFLESVVGSAHNFVGPWMTDSLGWRGVLVEPEKDRFLHLRFKHANRSRIQVLNAGITEVERPTISSLYDLYFMRKEQWEYPVFTILLGLETMNCDLLSFGGYGNELNILESLPYHRVNIDILAVHLTRDKHADIDKYGRLIEEFLSLQSYVLRERIGGTFLFQKYYNQDDEIATNLINSLPNVQHYSGILYYWNPALQKVFWSYCPNVCVLVLVYFCFKFFNLKNLIYRN